MTIRNLGKPLRQVTHTSFIMKLFKMKAEILHQRTRCLFLASLKRGGKYGPSLPQQGGMLGPCCMASTRMHGTRAEGLELQSLRVDGFIGSM